jgi:branched-chain amino acid transport system permease protein
LRFLQDWYLAIFGFAVIVLMVYLPGGLLSLGDRFKSGGGTR